MFEVRMRYFFNGQWCYHFDIFNEFSLAYSFGKYFFCYLDNLLDECFEVILFNHSTNCIYDMCDFDDYFK